jgi:hypothetical protein
MLVLKILSSLSVYRAHSHRSMLQSLLWIPSDRQEPDPEQNALPKVFRLCRLHSYLDGTAQHCTTANRSSWIVALGHDRWLVEGNSCNL